MADAGQLLMFMHESLIHQQTQSLKTILLNDIAILNSIRCLDDIQKYPGLVSALSQVIDSDQAIVANLDESLKRMEKRKENDEQRNRVP